MELEWPGVLNFDVTGYDVYRNGVKVGSDSAGNVYYRGKKDGKRWVIYNGPNDSSRIPPEWHGWIHHRVDTPPSRSALDFLDAPKRLEHFFSERVTRFFVKREGEKKGFIQRLRDKAGDLALTLLGKAFGESFVEEVQDFATAFQGLFSAFRERGVMVAHLLADPKTAFVVVSGADPVRVAEEWALVDNLSRGRVGISVASGWMLWSKSKQSPARSA